MFFARREPATLRGGSGISGRFLRGGSTFRGGYHFLGGGEGGPNPSRHYVILFCQIEFTVPYMTKNVPYCT